MERLSDSFGLQDVFFFASGAALHLFRFFQILFVLVAQHRIAGNLALLHARLVKDVYKRQVQWG